MDSFQNKKPMKRKSIFADDNNQSSAKVIKRRLDQTPVAPPAVPQSHFYVAERDSREAFLISGSELRQLVTQNSHQINAISQLRTLIDSLNSELSSIKNTLSELKSEVQVTKRRLNMMRDKEKGYTPSSTSRWDLTPSYIN